MSDFDAARSSALLQEVDGLVNQGAPQLTQREQEVLDAAARVFARRGYANATMEQVAAELGILKGSIYYYVKTKDDLLFGLVQQMMGRVEALYSAVAAETGIDPLERFALCMRRIVQFVAENLAAITVYNHDADLLEGGRSTWLEESRRRQWALVASMIAGAQEAGLADSKTDPLLLARLCIGTVTAVIRWFDPATMDVDEIADAVADLLLVGVIGENPGA
jgi:AcrR family transcriptional regulator